VVIAGKWARRVGHSLSLGYPDGSDNLDRQTEDRLFGRGLESWARPTVLATAHGAPNQQRFEDG